MARKHGWQLPAHTLQIVAITVFFLLVVAFYAFFAPFLGKQVLEYVAIGVYTPVALAVFILYVRCTSINPADPGIMSKFEDGFINLPNNSAGAEGMNLRQKPNNTTGTNSPTSTCRSSLDGHSNRRGLSIRETTINQGSQLPKKKSSCWFLGGLLCALFVKEDCRKADDSEQQENGEEALFCTLCDAEWLNNCVGRKNYFTFLALMAISLIWLAIEFGVGIAVMVLCFVDKNSTRNIQDRLGNGLTPAPFAVIVVRHIYITFTGGMYTFRGAFLLPYYIDKKGLDAVPGITTYDYVVAMRAMSEAAPEDEEEQISFILHQIQQQLGSVLEVHLVFTTRDEVIPHLDPGMVPSTVDPDAAGIDYSGTKEANSEMRLSPLQNSYPPSLASQDDYEAGTPTASSLSSPVHIHKLAPHSQFNPTAHPPPPVRPAPATQRPPVPTTQITNPMFQSATYIRDNRRTSVVWDQEAGRYVSVPAQTKTGPGVELPARKPHFLANSSGEPSHHGRNPAPGNTSSSAMPSGQPSERLTYTGQSIFFGGPILSTPGINAQRRNEAGTRAHLEGSRDPNARQRDIRGERARTGSLPVFAPGALKNPPSDK
ncbi:hypothetical protein PR202_ga16659 [Eleusine coracana subsp. coracana]|uniref:Protein S-acyltransferase n=1 Tax=Eleusine coracana subsp. coracana TaxID=191504 RepID=A0AAV5CNG0_ELECO|nr:hypothetical protein PR202_ga16659 [Eleusine coracana subsp. coracana]